MKQKEFNEMFVALISNKTKDSLELLAQIVDGPKLSASRALAVYREDYEARLIEALRNTYRGIHALIGDEDFNTLAQDYLISYSSCSPDLDEYGLDLANFLKTHKLLDDYRFLVEMAEFEWNFREVFHHKNEPGFSATELVALIQNERLEKIILIGSIRLMAFQFLISKLYALKDSSDEEPFDYEIQEYLLMYKHSGLVKTYSLSKNQMEIMKNFQAQTSLNDCLQNAPAMMTPDEIQGLFQILGMERLILKSK